MKERREKFLTAKYGSHQMALIRKRLAVEMWLYDELQKLYDSATSVSFICFYMYKAVGSLVTTVEEPMFVHIPN